jgi:carotenoid cleavage dioxygenase
MYFEAVCKFDLETETFVKRIKFGPTKAGGEVFFHKKENPKSEDDGYLMSFIYDWETKTSEFVMWDALTME